MRQVRFTWLGALLLGCVAGQVFAGDISPDVGPQPTPPVPPSSAAAERKAVEEMQSTEAKGALKSGAELYRKGEYDLAKDRLETVLTQDPANPAGLLLEGLTEVRLNNPAKASAQWEKFEKVETDPKIATEVGQMRTVLVRETAERAAKEAVGREKDLRGQITDPRTVAVATFRNAGTSQYAPLGKALAAMLIDNLSALPGVKVLEREQVEALEEEAKLGGSGLVEKGTAVRAGKLLRAGRVSAGSHVDWTASPTHVRLEALLVDVDSGATVAEGRSEAFATEFYKLVPAVAEKFAGALGPPVDRLPPAVQEKVQREHTHSVEAALAFGQALDALDHHDADGARKSCKEVENADPNFELAKKKCAFVPLTWLSLEGIAVAVEPTAYALAGAEEEHRSYRAAAIVGALVVGGIAGGTAAALSSGGGGGGGGGNNTPGNNPPQLNGVSDRTVGAGQTATIDMSCRDPDGTTTTITNPVAGPGGSFSQTSGNPSTGKYKQTTNQSQVGQTFGVRFACTDSGNPPASTQQDATIHVVQQAQPQPTPVPCTVTGEGAGCPDNQQCCSELCGTTPTGPHCCVPPQSSCTGVGDCCGGATSIDCQSGHCCVLLQHTCATDDDCCGAAGEAAGCVGGTCCANLGENCTSDADCCSGNCNEGSCDVGKP